MSNKIKWGILGVADIAVEHVIPAINNSLYGSVHSIASRSYEKAKNAANKLGIPTCYGSYEELLMNEEIDAIYNPLPNHLHIPWTIKCLEAGKHVLVEKPIGLSSNEALKLIDEIKKYPKLKVMEAFMYRHHPQWIKAKELVENGIIGEVKNIQSFFSFFDDNPDSIVNKKEFGGGSLMDIGCYPISLSRFIYDTEPAKVFADIEYHVDSGVDISATVQMKFGKGTSSFYSSIRHEDRQQSQIYGTQGKIEFEIPFNPVANKVSKLFLHKNGKTEIIDFIPCNQYSIQADLFAQAVIDGTDVPTPLSDSVANMRVIEKIIESDMLGKQVSL